MIEIVPDSDAVGRWIFERTAGKWIDGMGSCIGVARNGVLCAGMAYTQYTGPNLVVTLVIEDQRAVTRSTLHLCLWYPFEQLKCRRITAFVDADNRKSIRFLEHAGFTREATLVEAAPKGDVIVYRLFREDVKKWITPLKQKTQELPQATPSSLRQFRRRA